MRNDRMLKSVPVRTRMLGMESTTTAMQQSGWELSAEEDIRHMSMRFVARHREARMYAMSNTIPCNYFEGIDSRVVARGLIINFNYVANSMRLTLPMAGIPNFQPIDAVPQYVNVEEKDIEDFGFFAKPLVRTKEIIIPEKSVSSLLDELLAMQGERDKEYFERKMQESKEGERMDAHPQAKFHAQIISIA